MGRDGASWFADFLEQKSEPRTYEADQDTETETVSIAEERALLLQDAIENGGRLFYRIPVAGCVRERVLDVRDLLLKIKIELRHVRRERRLAHLRVTRH